MKLFQFTIISSVSILAAWLGNGGYAEWFPYRNHFYRGEVAYPVMAFFVWIVYFISTIVTVAIHFGIEGEDERMSPEHELAQYCSLLCGMYLYGYMAGPLHEGGAPLSPWVSLPTMSVLGILYSMVWRNSQTTDASST